MENKRPSRALSFARYRGVTLCGPSSAVRRYFSREASTYAVGVASATAVGTTGSVTTGAAT